jgi:hypothetical protein
VTPDLHVNENEIEKLIKLEFSASEPSGDLVKIVSQVMYESANKSGVVSPRDRSQGRSRPHPYAGKYPGVVRDD